MITGLGLVLLGVVGLWVGAEALVQGASRLGVRYRVSPVLVGVTLVSLGTSLPELVVSLLAAGRESPDLVLGNVLGSNMANVGLVLGITALVRPVRVAERLGRRDVPAVRVVTLVALPLLLGGVVGRLGAALLLGLFASYMAVLVRSARRRPVDTGMDTGEDPVVDAVDAAPSDAGSGSVDAGSGSGAGGVESPRGAAGASGKPGGGRRSPSALRPLLLAVGGALLLVGGGHGIVEGALRLAAVLGLPEVWVGLSVVALGTSLPELATTVVAALRGRSALAMGNIVGSNLFNLTVVLGGTAAVFPLAVPQGLVVAEYAATLALTVLLIPLVLTGRRVSRPEGLGLLVAYGLAWAWILHI